MPRSRNIKFGFFINDELAEIDPLGRILFIGLWCYADRLGRMEDRPKRLKGEILPYDNCDIDALLGALADRDFIKRYEVEGMRYIQIVNFLRHQNPHVHEQQSIIPGPGEHHASTMQAPDMHGASMVDAPDKYRKAIVQTQDKPGGSTGNPPGKHQKPIVNARLNPESGILNPESGIKSSSSAVAEKPAAALPAAFSELLAEGWGSDEILRAKAIVEARLNHPKKVSNWAGYLRPILEDQRNAVHSHPDRPRGDVYAESMAQRGKETVDAVKRRKERNEAEERDIEDRAERARAEARKLAGVHLKPKGD